MCQSCSVTGPDQPLLPYFHTKSLARKQRSLESINEHDILTLNGKQHRRNLRGSRRKRHIDAYKALTPEIKWVANPNKAQDVVDARRVQLLTQAWVAHHMSCAPSLIGRALNRPE